MVKNDGIPEIIETLKINGGVISIISPSFKIEDRPLSGKRILKSLERFGRICYKSETRITEDSAYPFLGHAIKIGHFSIIEHEKVTVRLIMDRGVSHEWVRHRLAAYSQESTRYCNYGKLGFQYVYPFFYQIGSPEYEEWKKAIIDATSHYLNLLTMGRKPQEARGVLPNSLKTELIATHNIRQWRHIFYQRGDKAAHPQYREILLPLCAEFQKIIPVLFDDLEIDWENSVIKIKPKEAMLEIVDKLERLLRDIPEGVESARVLREKIQNLVIST